MSHLHRLRDRESNAWLRTGHTPCTHHPQSLDEGVIARKLPEIEARAQLMQQA
jgi:hypothetical protein